MVNIIEKFSAEDIIKYKELLSYESLSIATPNEIQQKLEEANYNNIAL